MLKIDGVDFTEYVNRFGVVETPRRVTGPNTGTAMDGSYIEDLITIKHDVSFVVKPLRPEKMKILLNAISKEYVIVEYLSISKNEEVTITAVPSSSSIELLTFYAQKAVYGNLTISFMEK